MPPTKKKLKTTGSYVLARLEKTPLKTNKKARDLITDGQSLAEFSVTLQEVMAQHVFDVEQYQGLVSQIPKIFSDDEDYEISADHKRAWHSALFLEAIYKADQLTSEVLQDQLLVSALEFEVDKLQDDQKNSLAEALKATPVEGPGLEAVVEGILDKLVPPDEAVLAARSDFVQRALQTTGMEVDAGDAKVDSDASDSDESSESGKGSGADEEGGDAAGADPSDPLFTADTKDMNSRTYTVQDLKDFLKKLGVEVPKTASTKKALVDLVLKEREKKK